MCGSSWNFPYWTLSTQEHCLPLLSKKRTKIIIIPSWVLRTRILCSHQSMPKKSFIDQIAIQHVRAHHGPQYISHSLQNLDSGEISWDNEDKLSTNSQHFHSHPMEFRTPWKIHNILNFYYWTNKFDKLFFLHNFVSDHSIWLWYLPSGISIGLVISRKPSVYGCSDFTTQFNCTNIFFGVILSAQSVQWSPTFLNIFIGLIIWVDFSEFRPNSAIRTKFSKFGLIFNLGVAIFKILTGFQHSGLFFSPPPTKISLGHDLATLKSSCTNFSAFLL